MGLTRRSKFGFPPKQGAPSTTTVRMVPLSQGVKQDVAWPLQQPGSAVSLVNFLPVGGKLVPRSRCSSLNTIRIPTVDKSINGIAESYFADGNATAIWLSAGTQHAVLTSNGSISLASFVSSFGLGAASIADGDQRQYAPVFLGSFNENVLLTVLTDSYDTVMALYQTGGSPTGRPLFSYLTSAPQTRSLAVYDNYVIAWNVATTAGTFISRVQWSQRGNPSNWTGEGSGFEDLLAMRGRGKAVHATSDGRLILFGDAEVWYGLSAPYPSQFQFAPLDSSVGCPYPGTIVDTDEGLLFLGSDLALRLLPKGGGASTVVSAAIADTLQMTKSGIGNPYSWGVYEPATRIYHLFIESTTLSFRGIVVNVATGEWGFSDYNANAPQVGLAIHRSNSAFGSDIRLLFGNSTGTVFSDNSKIHLENGSVVTSKYQSQPVAADLAGGHKLLNKVCLDYRATSKATVTLNISGDAYSYQSAGVMSLVSAPVAGRVHQDVYRGGQTPTIEFTSTSTGYELHRVDVNVGLNGR
jgi:hypothetical protein